MHLDDESEWGFGTIDITEKGRRNRIIDIKSMNDLVFIKDAIQGKALDEPLVPIYKDSINKFLNRTMKKVGIKPKYPVTSIHSIRKMYAQETWDQCRTQDKLTWNEALEYVNLQLGHGEKRNKTLLAVYVKNMW